MKNIRYIIFAGAICLSLGACASMSDSDQNKGPVGIGNSINELKQSPCACTEIPMHAPDGSTIG